MSLSFVEISGAKLEEARLALQGSFTISTPQMKLSIANGIHAVAYGVYEAEQVRAVAIMNIYAGRMTTYAQCIFCACDDWHNEQLVTFFMEQLKRAAVTHGAVSLNVLPKALYARRNSEGDIVEYANEHLTEIMQQCGFSWNGLTREMLPVRYMYVKDLSNIHNEKELLQSYGKKARGHVKLAMKKMVTVRELRRDELQQFYDICKMSASKHEFKSRSLDYFHKCYDIYGDAAHFTVAQLNTTEYVNVLYRQLEELEQEIEQLQIMENLSMRQQGQLKSLKHRKPSLLQSIEWAEQCAREDGEIIPMNVSLFIEDANEMIYLFSGNNAKYAKCSGSSLLQHWAMLRAIEKGIRRYNFYGISGYFQKGEPGYTILEFKQGFNGYIEEYIGNFIAILRPVRYSVFHCLHHLLRR